jgi:hypothetical protein
MSKLGSAERAVHLAACTTMVDTVCPLVQQLVRQVCLHAICPMCTTLLGCVDLQVAAAFVLFTGYPPFLVCTDGMAPEMQVQGPVVV